MQYILTEQLKNIALEFASRASMTGKEVPAYVQLINALSNGVEEPKKEDAKKDENVKK